LTLRQSQTHWLNHSLVLASDYRVPDPERVGPLLERRQDSLRQLGAHHVLVYASTTDPGRVLVMIAIHSREPVLELLRSRVFFDWFDAVGVDDIPAVFAGEEVERLVVTADTKGSRRAAPEVMVSVVTSVDDVPNLVSHVRETIDELRVSGIRTVLIFSAFDDPREVMLLLQIDDEAHARDWLRHSDLAAEWLQKAGIGAYPPVFVGRFRRMIQVDEADRTGNR
jgi:hypothetical protein